MRLFLLADSLILNFPKLSQLLFINFSIFSKNLKKGIEKKFIPSKFVFYDYFLNDVTYSLFGKFTRTNSKKSS